MNKQVLFFSAFIAVNSVPSFATEQNVADNFFLDDTPVVLSATRLKQSLSEAPAALTVIDRAMIKASGAKEIFELFRLVPGMQVGYKRKPLPSVSYHGMSDEFAGGMQILVDGHSIYSASFGGLLWIGYPLLIEDIERIEVIRGPSSSTYGPNAFLGTINIITTHTSQDQGAQANFRAGGGDYYRGAARYGGKWKDLGYRFSFAHNEDDGLESDLDAQDVNQFNSRFDYQLSNKDTLQYNFGYSERKYQLDINNLADPSHYERGSHLSQNLRWEHQVNASDQVTLQLTHNRNEIFNDFIANGKAFSNDQLAERIDLELQHIFSPFQDTRVVWGLGSRIDRARLRLWIGDEDDKTNVLHRAFANIEWKFLDDFSLNLGALLEENSYTNVDVSPKIALNYLWSEQHSFRIMASRASRMPTLAEQNLNIENSVPNLVNVRAQTPETLKPEEVITFEAGHHGQFFNKKLLTDIKFAHQRFHRLTQIISVDFDPDTFEPVFQYGTSDVASSLNYEIQVDYKPDPKTLVHMGYSWININQGGGFINYRESAPHHTLNFLAAYEFPHQWQASMGYYYRSEMQYLRSDVIGQFQRLDFILRKSINLTDSQKLELSLIHQNNLGSKDEFEQGDRLADRTFFEVAYQYD